MPRAWPGRVAAGAGERSGGVDPLVLCAARTSSRQDYKCVGKPDRELLTVHARPRSESTGNTVDCTATRVARALRS